DRPRGRRVRLPPARLAAHGRAHRRRAGRARPRAAPPRRRRRWSRRRVPRGDRHDRRFVIVVATTAANDRTIAWYLESYGAPLRDTITPVHYEVLLDDPDPVAATYCFADLELMSADQLERAADLRQRLLARGCRVLNDPARTMRRFELN